MQKESLYKVSKERSKNMAAIKSKNTNPEIKVRKLLHSLGYRFRLHKIELPGSPDIVLKKYKTVVFVHGCFWHRHKECKYASNPKTREEFWNKKFISNIERDIKVRERIKAAGWKSIVVWECELKDIQKLKKRLIPLFDK
jgi:DNA mismatch endonuclease (patch repair protein)